MIRPEIRVFSDDLVFDDFNCSNEEVNKFLKEQASAETRDDLTKVFVVRAKTRVIAYVAVMCSHYRYKPSGYSREFRVPGLLIGQLGVDARFERKKIGSMLIDYCISIAMEIKRYAACRIIYVESFDDAVEFYRKHNFVLLDNGVRNRNKMILDLKMPDGTPGE